MTSRRRSPADAGPFRQLLDWLSPGAGPAGRAAPQPAPRYAGITEQLRANERIWGGFRDLELRMLAAGSLGEVLVVLTRLLPECFPAVHAVSVAWLDPEYEMTRLLERESADVRGFVALAASELAAHLPDDVPRLGPADEVMCQLLFPRNPPGSIGSLAIAPLRVRGQRVGSLNQASRDRAHFAPEAATDLLEHLAAVAAICIDNAVNRARLEHDVITDPLTGVANRRFFTRRLQEELGQWERHGGSVSCLLIDLDHFKQINDHHGHQAGDEALRRVAGLLGESLRTSDVLARYGGEEFALLLPQTDGAQALDIAERLRARIAARPLQLAAGLSLSVTTSIGCATLCETDRLRPAMRGDWLVGRADAALYAAKSQGRNRAVAMSAGTA